MTNAAATNRRPTLIKLIHVARRELGMAEDSYRAILRDVGKADSLTDMSISKLIDVLEHLKKCGFKVRPKAGERQLTINPDASKVRALWLFLHQLGAVRDPSEKALAAYCKRIAHVDDLRWARGDAVTALIETLKKWAMRYLPNVVAGLLEEAAAACQARTLTARQLAHCQDAKQRLRRGQGFDAHWWAWEDLQAALGRTTPAELEPLREQQA